MTSQALSSRSRSLLVVLAFLTGTFFFATPELLPTAAYAQDAEEGKEAKPPEKDTGGHSWIKILSHILKSVGIVFGIVLGLVSIALVTLVILLVLELRMEAAVPPAFVEEFTDTVNRRKFKEAYELAKEDPSFVARVLTSGMSRLQYGIEDAREASASMLESVKASKEQLIVYLATIGTLGPLLGLVGTVFGMILSFMTLSSGSQINAQKLADDISHALVVTLLGIGLSVPAIFAHAIFKNRLTRVSHDAGTVADDLLTQMYYNSKKAAGAPSGPGVDMATENRSAPVPPPPQVKAK